MKKISIFGRRHRASSLVVTLLVLVVLSTIVVAFLQSMSVERLTAKSQTNIYRSQLAAQAGMEVAMQQIRLATAANPAYVVGQSNDAANLGAILVIGQNDLTNPSQLMPLISGEITNLNGFPSANSNSVLAYLNARTNTNSANSVNINVKNSLIEITADANKYRASWVYLTNSDGTTNGRYAYFITDEWAKINPRYHGDTSLSRTNATNWFTGVGALPLYTGDTNFFTSTNDGIAMRNIATNTQYPPLTPLTIGQAFATRSNYDIKRQFITMDDTLSPDVIPADLPQGGRPKYNINDLATNVLYGATAEARATNIAGIIQANLTNFGKRDLGLTMGSPAEDPTGGRYVQRIAASIVDYIDTDSVPTMVNTNEPAGMEATPYVAVVGERVTWVSQAGSAPNFSVVMKSDYFVQLWNPYTVSVSGTAKFQSWNRLYVDMPNGGVGAPLQPFDSQEVAVTLRPNEFKAYNFGSTNQTYTSPVNPSTAANNPTNQVTKSEASSIYGHPQFRFLWNGNIVQMNRTSDPDQPTNPVGPTMPGGATAGLVHVAGAWKNPGFVRWFFNCLPCNAPNTVADPRIIYLSTTDWLNQSTAYWQGRQTDTLNQAGQNFASTWLSRDYIPNNPTVGLAFSSTVGDPTSLASQWVAADGTNAPAYIRNDAMQSIGELGNIFDPIQVNDNGTNTSGGANKPGGGYSLRIGQPEFIFANTNGKRAIELLDLFTVNSTNTFSTNYPVTRGRININTAPQEVLEALFYNIAVASDGNKPAGVINTAKLTNFTKAILANRPYSKLSDLYKMTPALVVGTNYSPALAATPLVVAADANNQYASAKVLDRAREEAFSKIVGLCTVQSRAFRLYVIGESLNPRTGKREGRSVLESIISVQDGTNGAVPPTLSPQVKYLRWEN